jgi:hypothetical protein
VTSLDKPRGGDKVSATGLALSHRATGTSPVVSLLQTEHAHLIAKVLLDSLVFLPDLFRLFTAVSFQFLLECGIL